jgi:hypothetical protein
MFTLDFVQLREWLITDLIAVRPLLDPHLTALGSQPKVIDNAPG